VDHDAWRSGARGRIGPSSPKRERGDLFHWSSTLKARVALTVEIRRDIRRTAKAE